MEENKVNRFACIRFYYTAILNLTAVGVFAYKYTVALQRSVRRHSPNSYIKLSGIFSAARIGQVEFDFGYAFGDFVAYRHIVVGVYPARLNFAVADFPRVVGSVRRSRKSKVFGRTPNIVCFAVGPCVIFIGADCELLAVVCRRIIGCFGFGMSANARVLRFSFLIKSRLSYNLTLAEFVRRKSRTVTAIRTNFLMSVRADIRICKIMCIFFVYSSAVDAFSCVTVFVPCPFASEIVCRAFRYLFSLFRSAIAADVDPFAVRIARCRHIPFRIFFEVVRLAFAVYRSAVDAFSCVTVLVPYPFASEIVCDLFNGLFIAFRTAFNGA